MKFRRTAQKAKIRATIDLIPLINCVFLLLLFFMLSGSFVTQDDINIRMPVVTGSAPALQEKDISITLTQDEILLPEDKDNPRRATSLKSNLFVNELPMQGIHQLESTLEALHTSKPDMRVLVRSDARVESARLIQVLGIVKALGFEHCAIAAQSADEVASASTGEEAHP